MADAAIIVIERDWLGRRVRTETFAPGDPTPAWVSDALPDRETQVSDPREEVKATEGPVAEGKTAEHQGAGWYELPGGETVRGKDAVREAGYEVP